MERYIRDKSVTKAESTEAFCRRKETFQGYIYQVTNQRQQD